MSYATSLAKLDASTGLIAAAVPGLIYAFLGTSRHLNVGPEAALSLLIGQAIDQVRHGDPHEEVPASIGIAIATMITFQVWISSLDKRWHGNINLIFRLGLSPLCWDCSALALST